MLAKLSAFVVSLSRHVSLGLIDHGAILGSSFVLKHHVVLKKKSNNRSEELLITAKVGWKECFGDVVSRPVLISIVRGERIFGNFIPRVFEPEIARKVAPGQLLTDLFREFIRHEVSGLISDAESYDKEMMVVERVKVPDDVVWFDSSAKSVDFSSEVKTEGGVCKMYHDRSAVVHFGNTMWFDAIGQLNGDFFEALFPGLKPDEFHGMALESIYNLDKCIKAMKSNESSFIGYSGEVKLIS